jgi:ferritin-like protein
MMGNSTAHKNRTCMHISNESQYWERMNHEHFLSRDLVKHHETKGDFMSKNGKQYDEIFCVISVKAKNCAIDQFNEIFDTNYGEKRL